MKFSLPGFRLALLTATAMLAFAANSWLCRMALQRTGIDPASFTAVRLAAGATVLALSVGSRKRVQERARSWATAATRAAARSGRPGGANGLFHA